MNELTLDGKTYVSSKRAAEITGYAKDYVGQLCREGHVEARLVGRNWYVLESSIRAHRFGVQETIAEQPDMAVQSWPKAKYIAEEPSPLPVFDAVEDDTPEVVVPTEPEIEAQRGAVFTDMESAWKEWFTHKEEIPVAIEESIIETEPIEEVPESVEEYEAPQAVYRAVDEEEETPVAVLRVEREDAREVLDLAHAEPEEEAVVIEERVYTRRRHPVMGNLVIQSMFIGTALIVATLAVIGTGYAQRIVGTSLYRLPEINFIAGVSEINKPVK